MRRAGGVDIWERYRRANVDHRFPVSGSAFAYEKSSADGANSGSQTS
jgi:hypothetical protein